MERTGRRVINLDLKNEVFDLKCDELTIFSVEIQFIIAFFSCLLFNKGYSQEEVVVWLSDIEQRGIIKGYQTFKEMLEKTRGPDQK